MRRSAALLAFLIAITACDRAREQAANDSAAVSNEAPAAVPPEPGTPGGLADDRTPLAEPKGPIDPKSVEAAGQVVQHYGALIERGRWTESWKLWSSADAARQFDRNWLNDSEVHMEIGKPASTEGAAGSIYTTVPVVFYGKTKAGGSFSRKADVILRRVNDVPGSTEAQRRWRIERVELAAA